MFSTSFFYDLQSRLLEKVVWLVWSECQVSKHISVLLFYKTSVQKTEISNVKSRSAEGFPIKLAGDGKFDSRGN